MNYLRRTALVLLLFFVMIIIISLFLSSSFQMERKVIVDADKEQIFKNYAAGVQRYLEKTKAGI